jgi:SAM-dependent methyltransferase
LGAGVGGFKVVTGGVESAPMSNAIIRSLAYYFAMGPAYFYWKVRESVHPHRLRMLDQLSSFSGSGLEIGGSSEVFSKRGLFPIYETCSSLDNVTFRHSTAWEGVVREGKTFRFHAAKEPGQQFVMEGAALGSMTACSYDFVASSHMLEHSANPLAALFGWKRVLRENGRLLLVLPHRDGTFDHRRPVTNLEHLVQDFSNQVDENDQTHLDEILRLHDLRRDPAQPSRDHFERWIFENHVNRGAHQHVFDMRSAVEMLNYTGFQIIDVEAARPFHICLLAGRLAESATFDNSEFLKFDGPRYQRSPFRTDRSLTKPHAAGRQGTRRAS